MTKQAYLDRVNEKYRTDPEFRDRKIKASSARWKRTRDDRSEQPARLFRAARSRAKKAGLEFTIEVADVVIPDRCPILDVPLGLVGSPYAPSLDRIDNNRGYVKGNVAVISKLANQMKGLMVIADAERLLAYMRTAT